MNKLQEIRHDALKLSKLNLFPKIKQSASTDTIRLYKDQIITPPQMSKQTKYTKLITSNQNKEIYQSNLNKKTKTHSTESNIDMFQTTNKIQIEITYQTQNELMADPQSNNTFYGSFYNYKQMFKVSDDNKQSKPQNMSNILHRNTQLITDQIVIKRDSQYLHSMSSKDLLSNFKNRLKVLLHQKDAQRNQTIKYRDPRCYNIKPNTTAKINFRVKVDSYQLQQKLEVLVKDLHLALESKVSYSQVNMDSMVLVTMTKLRDEFKYVCQDYNDFYHNNEQKLDPNFYYEFLKSIVIEIKSRTSLKNSISVFDEFVKERWDPSQDIEEQQEAEVLNIEEKQESEPIQIVEIIPIPIPVPPPLPQNKTTKKTEFVQRQAQKKVTDVISKQQVKRNGKQRQPRDSMVSLSPKKERKKRNTQQFDTSEAVSQKSGRSQDESIDGSINGDQFQTIRKTYKKTQIQEESSVDSNSTPLISDRQQRCQKTQSFVNSLPSLPKSKTVSRQSANLSDQINVQNPKPLNLVEKEDPNKIKSVEQKTLVLKIRPHLQEVQDQNIEQIPPQIEEVVEPVKLEVQLNSDRSRDSGRKQNIPLKITVSKPVVQKRTVVTDQKIKPFQYSEEQMLKKVQQQQALQKRLSVFQLANYKPNLLDLISQSENIYEFDFNNHRIVEEQSKDIKDIWSNDMKYIIEDFDILKIEI